jgi:molybdenum cofactor cytidylyltransferase
MPEARPRPLRFGAIVLAAGGSTRMGATKQLLRIGGTSLVARAADAAIGSGARPVAVVVGADAESVRAEISGKEVLAAHNPDWATGLASSIRVGLSALLGAEPELDAVVVAPCDQPALSSDTIARLASVHQSSGLIAAARFGGRNGAPAVFGREHFPMLSKLGGDEGARRILNSNDGLVSSLDLPELGTDLDTPADYAAWTGARP